MNIVVCVKHVPDAQGERRFADSDLTTDRAAVDGLLSELDEYAVEEALTLAEASGQATVTAVTMGPAAAADALRKALQMGVDAGLHIQDDALHGSDAPATARVLAAAIATLQPDVVVAGMASTDAGMSVVPAMLAQHLGLPQVTFAGAVTLISDGERRLLRAERESDTRTEVIEAELPALLSVTDQINEPRYPTFKGIMAAKKKPVRTVDLAELGIPAAEVGLSAAWTAVEKVTPRPPRQAGRRVDDDGEGGRRLVEFLTDAKLI